MKKLILATFLALAAISGATVAFAPAAFADCPGKHAGA